MGLGEQSSVACRPTLGWLVCSVTTHFLSFTTRLRKPACQGCCGGCVGSPAQAHPFKPSLQACAAALLASLTSA